jgi:hypothetical protein
MRFVTESGLFRLAGDDFEEVDTKRCRQSQAGESRIVYAVPKANSEQDKSREIHVSRA